MIGTLFEEHRPFDAPFYVTQLAAILLWLLACATVRRQQFLRARPAIVLGFAVVTEFLLPAVWNVVAPVRYGFDFLLVLIGFALTAVQASLSCLWARWAVIAAADGRLPRGPGVRV